METRVCIFSAIMVDPDKPDYIIDQPGLFNKIPGFDYILFTNAKEKIIETSWTVVQVEIDQQFPRQFGVYANRFVKWHPLLFIDKDKYDVVIYVDGFQVPNPTMAWKWKALVLQLMQGNADIVHCMHPHKVNVYQEVSRNHISKKERLDVLEKIHLFLKTEGFPDDIKIFWNGCYILKVSQSTDILGVWDAMWQKMLTISYRDQLLYRYFLWKTGYNCYKKIMLSPLDKLIQNLDNDKNHTYV